MTQVKVKRSRNSRPCLSCQIRKIKCDSKEKVPCTNCVEAGNDCKLVKLQARAKRKPRSKESILPYPYFLQSNQQSNQHNQPVDPGIYYDNQ